MCKLITCAKGVDDLSIRIDGDRDRRQRPLTQNENRTGRYHVGYMLRDVSYFAKIKKKLRLFWHTN